MFQQAMELVVMAIEAIGIAAVTLGTLAAMITALWRWRRDEPGVTYRRFRRDLGRSILIGLELLVAADIVRTVAIEPTLENVAVLGLLILVRTVLSFALEVELNGHWPWKRPRESGPLDPEEA